MITITGDTLAKMVANAMMQLMVTSHTSGLSPVSRLSTRVKETTSLTRATS